MRLLEAKGREAVTMRAVAAELGLQAPSLYKHYRDKRALEAAVIALGLSELGSTIERALTVAGNQVQALAESYRRFAIDRPRLYRLMNDGPLPRDLLPAGLEDAVSAPLLRVFGNRNRARAAWGAAHGLASLELAGRFPEDADLGAAWAEVVRAFG